jgi:hypothetical protein
MHRKLFLPDIRLFPDIRYGRIPDIRPDIRPDKISLTLAGYQAGYSVSALT